MLALSSVEFCDLLRLKRHQQMPLPGLLALVATSTKPNYLRSHDRHPANNVQSDSNDRDEGSITRVYFSIFPPLFQGGGASPGETGSTTLGGDQ
jgi:hypothetical protein